MDEILASNDGRQRAKKTLKSISRVLSGLVGKKARKNHPLLCLPVELLTEILGLVRHNWSSIVDSDHSYIYPHRRIGKYQFSNLSMVCKSWTPIVRNHMLCDFGVLNIDHVHILRAIVDDELSGFTRSSGVSCSSIRSIRVVLQPGNTWDSTVDLLERLPAVTSASIGLSHQINDLADLFSVRWPILETLKDLTIDSGGPTGLQAFTWLNKLGNLRRLTYCGWPPDALETARMGITGGSTAKIPHVYSLECLHLLLWRWNALQIQNVFVSPSESSLDAPLRNGLNQTLRSLTFGPTADAWSPQDVYQILTTFSASLECVVVFLRHIDQSIIPDNMPKLRELMVHSQLTSELGIALPNLGKLKTLLDLELVNFDFLYEHHSWNTHEAINGIEAVEMAPPSLKHLSLTIDQDATTNYKFLHEFSWSASKARTLKSIELQGRSFNNARFPSMVTEPYFASIPLGPSLIPTFRLDSRLCGVGDFFSRVLTPLRYLRALVVEYDPVQIATALSWDVSQLTPNLICLSLVMSNPLDIKRTKAIAKELKKILDPCRKTFVRLVIVSVSKILPIKADERKVFEELKRLGRDTEDKERVIDVSCVRPKDWESIWSLWKEGDFRD